MGNKSIKTALLSLWGVLLSVLLCAGLYSYILPEEIHIGDGVGLPSYPCLSFTTEEKSVAGDPTVSRMDARLFGLVSLKKVEVKDYSGLRLIPSGSIFGVKMQAEGVYVVGVCEVQSREKCASPATMAGLSPKDLILAINDSPIKTVGELSRMIEGSAGAPITVRYRRGGTEKTTELVPLLDVSDGKYKAGLWARDNATGIGTITYINPDTGEFGALGHGVCDAESGTLLSESRGIITEAVVTDIVAGTKSKPGELKGYLRASKIGTMTKNTDCGIFGALATVPTQEALPVGLSHELKEGKATLRTMLSDGTPHDYEIEIVEIHGKSPNKSFTVRITDPALLQKTGGIVQGMSGSPIIQNGKLVGAVTHVMLSDPKMGYGIFIENMLAASEDQATPKAA